MKSSILNNSSSQKSIEKGIHDSILTKEYLENVTDSYMSHLSELIEEADPKKLHQKVINKRLQQQKKAQQQRRKLLQANRLLKNELNQAIQEIKQLRNQIEQNGGAQSSNQMSIQSPPSQKSEPSEQSETNSKKIGHQYQQNMLNFIDQQHQNARQQQQEIQNSLHKMQLFLKKVFTVLDTKIEFNLSNTNVVYDQHQPTVTIKKEKYQKLLQSYIHSSLLTFKNQPQDQNEVKEFKADDKNQVSSPKQPNSVLTAQETEDMFRALAQKAGKKQEWLFYLTQRRGQAQSQLAQFKAILKSDDDLQQKKLIQQTSSIIRKNESMTQQTIQLSKIQETIQADKQLQQSLFKRIKQLLIKLPLKKQELQLFNRFDMKRKYDRLFDLDEFVNKFKNKQDLFEISNFYADYMLKTINSLMLKVMEVFTQTQSKFSSYNPEQYPFKWFIKKLEDKTKPIKDKIMTALETEFNQYLLQKNPPKKFLNPIQQRKQITEIKAGQFDKEKKLECELLRTVNEYRNILDSSVFYCNGGIKINF